MSNTWATVFTAGNRRMMNGPDSAQTSSSVSELQSFLYFGS